MLNRGTIGTSLAHSFQTSTSVARSPFYGYAISTRDESSRTRPNPSAISQPQHVDWHLLDIYNSLEKSFQSVLGRSTWFPSPSSASFVFRACLHRAKMSKASIVFVLLIERVSAAASARRISTVYPRLFLVVYRLLEQFSFLQLYSAWKNGNYALLWEDFLGRMFGTLHQSLPSSKAEVSGQLGASQLPYFLYRIGSPALCIWTRQLQLRQKQDVLRSLNN